MDFFEHQERARRKSTVLVLLFAVAVVSLVVIADLCAYYFCESQRMMGNEIDTVAVLQACTALNLALILGGTFLRLFQLRAGGPAVARMIGATPVDAATEDEALRRFRNTAEEMAIAAGMAMPQLFVIEKSKSINAFAAGWSPEDSAVVVTRGALDELTREQLQGVVAHEFSHIFNSDMRLNLQLLGVLNGIVWVGGFGRGLLDMSMGRRRRGFSSRDSAQVQGAFVLAGVVFFALGYLGSLAARLIQYAVARQREYLADASAAQFTRHPTGLASALAKIMYYPAPIESFSFAVAGQSLNHMAFAPLASEFFFATHPSLESRVERLIPGAIAKTLVEPEAWKRWQGLPGSQYLKKLVRGNRPAAEPTPSRPRAVEMGLAPALAASVGNPSHEHWVYSQSIVDSLPTSLRDWIHHRQGAQAFGYALFLAPDREQQKQQLRRIPASIGVEKVVDFHDALEKAGPRVRLPWMELALPALKRLKTEERRDFLEQLEGLALVDGIWTATEFLYFLFLKGHLGPPRGVAAILPTAPAKLQHAQSLLIGFLGSVEKADRPVEPVPLETLEQAIHLIDHSSPLFKRAFLQSCVARIEHDGEVGVCEAEALRVVSESLRCPMPPVLNALDQSRSQVAPGLTQKN